ncbi:MAG: L,D-transpeptidase [Rhizobiales bacterium]|nr:L,D-transpeptidase [Hyphomicrobiales bacterium]MBI3672299.1 L,D-transpeptidase [Hyphomicrobiales bacterium]
MNPILTRRGFALAGLAIAALPLPAWADATQPPFDSPTPDPALLPPPESPIDYPILTVDLGTIPAQFRRQEVKYDGPEAAGTIIVDPGDRYLFHVRDGGMAVRYGVGVGRAGFGWSGEAKVGMKRRWPRWVPPPDMVTRDKNAAKWANGMPGGPDNPLGARALYLFAKTLYANYSDTGYRIHGTNDPSSIGKAVSSGCIRLLNQDVAELYDEVPIGNRVVVRPAAPEPIEG